MSLDNFKLAVFECGLRQNFIPLSLTRPTFDLHFGTGSLLERVESRLGVKAEYLYVPDYLKRVAQEKHPNAKINEHISQKCLAVNPLLGNAPKVWSAIEDALELNEKSVFVDGTGTPLFAVLDELRLEWVENNFQKVRYHTRPALAESESSPIMSFPWRLVDENGSEIELTRSSKKRSQSNLPNGAELIGDKLIVSPTAEIQRFVTLDSRSGPIIIEDNARVESFSYLTGPCFIGENVVVKSARIGHGSSVAECSRVAGEVEQSIISEYSNKSHEGYLGHSLIGSWVNLGALTTTSDLKNTYGEIKVSIGGKTINTESVKVGAFVGDMAKTGVGSTITCGKSIGVSSHVLGSVQSNIPSFTMQSSAPRTSAVEIYIDSAIETQRRMMKRRGVSISEAYVSMIKTVFKLTKKDRSRQHILKRRFG